MPEASLVCRGCRCKAMNQKKFIDQSSLPKTLKSQIYIGRIAKGRAAVPTVAHKSICIFTIVWQRSSNSVKVRSKYVGQIRWRKVDQELTLWLKVVKSLELEICTMYRVSFSNSRSAHASGVWAFLKAEIFKPSFGFNAKLRLWEDSLVKFGSQDIRGKNTRSSTWIVFLELLCKRKENWVRRYLKAPEDTYNWGKWFHMICRALTECVHGLLSLSVKTVNIQVLSSTGHDIVSKLLQETIE